MEEFLKYDLAKFESIKEKKKDRIAKIARMFERDQEGFNALIEYLDTQIYQTIENYRKPENCPNELELRVNQVTDYFLNKFRLYLMKCKKLTDKKEDENNDENNNDHIPDKD